MWFSLALQGNNLETRKEPDRGIPKALSFDGDFVPRLTMSQPGICHLAHPSARVQDGLALMVH